MIKHKPLSVIFKNYIDNGIVLVLLIVLIFGRNAILFLFIKKVTNKSLIIMDQFIFYQLAVKLLLNSIFKFLDVNNLLSSNNQDSDHQVPVNINFSQ